MGSLSETTPLLSVIVPTCHRNEDLTRCLKQLQPQSQGNAADGPGAVRRDDFTYEIIVSDDGSRSTAEGLIRDQFPWVRWCSGPRRGPAANRNSGARNARGQWVLFLDDDCIPSSGWISAYASAIRSFPDCKLLEGQTIGGPNSQTHSDHETPLNLQGGLLWSCNFGISRELFLDVGGFDEKFPVAYMEDTDLQFRLKERGYVSKFVPDARVQHPWRRRKRIYFAIAYARSLCYFVAKHPETRQVFAEAWGVKRMIKIVTFEFPKNFFRFRDLAAFRCLYWDLVMAFEVSRNLPRKNG
jgi:GT2 family glycosyltransferase